MSKKDNAAIVLSDSIALQDNRVSYRDLSGFLGNAMSALRSARIDGTEICADETLSNLITQMRGSKERLPTFLRKPFDGEAETSDSTYVFRTGLECLSCRTLNSSDATACKSCKAQLSAAVSSPAQVSAAASSSSSSSTNSDVVDLASDMIDLTDD